PFVQKIDDWRRGVRKVDIKKKGTSFFETMKTIVETMRPLRDERRDCPYGTLGLKVGVCSQYQRDVDAG
ncbi:MAG: hypothetical protein AAFV78_11905, partial [Bacteroidota bacterium]